MPSVVAICNTALSRLGDSATVASIDPPEGSAQAEHCATFYPIARDTLLESHVWSFATRRADLALLTSPSWNWRFAYAKPANCLKVVSVLGPHECAAADSADYQTESTDTGTPIILTNLQDATIRYISRVEDSTKFPPLFTDALSWLLASYLAGPLIKGETGLTAGRAAYATHLQQLAAAKVSDANQQHGDPRSYEGRTPWIEARNYQPENCRRRGY